MSDDHKKSWREIDQRRDRGFQKTPKKVGPLEARAQKLASKEAKSELEKLFSTGKVAKEKSNFLEELKNLRGKPDYYTRMSENFEKNGVPLDWELQSLYLDHRDPRIVMAVLAELKKTAPTSDLQKQDLLAAKLKVMALSVFDRDLLAAIKDLQSALLRT